jgi:hypothetical protein
MQIQTLKRGWSVNKYELVIPIRHPPIGHEYKKVYIYHMDNKKQQIVLMTKRKIIKRQTKIDKTLHRKLKIEQQEPH